MSKNGYIGPKLVPGTGLHAYGRYINPDIWTDEEKEYWFKVEPRYKQYFAAHASLPKLDTDAAKPVSK